MANRQIYNVATGTVAIAGATGGLLPKILRWLDLTGAAETAAGLFVLVTNPAINWEAVWLFLMVGASLALVAINIDWASNIYKRLRELHAMKPDMTVASAIGRIAHDAAEGMGIDPTRAVEDGAQIFQHAAICGKIAVYGRRPTKFEWVKIPPVLFKRHIIHTRALGRLPPDVIGEADSGYGGALVAKETDDAIFIALRVYRYQVDRLWPALPQRRRAREISRDRG